MAQSMLEQVQRREVKSEKSPAEMSRVETSPARTEPVAVKPEGRRRPAPAPESRPAPSASVPSEPVSSSSNGEPAWYVYGVVAADRVDEDQTPLGIDSSHSVGTLSEGSLAAVYSYVAVDEFDDARLRANLADMAWIERVARTHEGVLEWTQQRTTVVPMRMCTVYRDEAGVREMLRREADALTDALVLLEGKDEWGVKVLVDPSAQTRPGTDTGDEEGPDAGALYMRRRQDELDQAEKDAQALEAAAGQIHEQLSAVAVDSLVAPAQRAEANGYEAEMVLNGIYLVEQRTASEFHQQVRALDEQYREFGLRLVETGPWPAYNFVAGAIGAPW